MSVKKILLLSATCAAAISMTAAMAGGFTQEPMSMTAMDNGYYIEGNLGYARQDYYDSMQWSINTSVSSNNNSNVYGGFAAGVDAGYQINRHVALELGWFYLPDVDIMPSTAASSWLSSWVLYLAAKYMMPIPMINSTSLYFKVGVAYTRGSVSAAEIASPISTGTSTYVRPMFATGLDYSFSDSWVGVFQYAYFLGAANSYPFTAANTGALGTVAANVFTLGLGYKFTV